MMGNNEIHLNNLSYLYHTFRFMTLFLFCTSTSKTLNAGYILLHFCIVVHVYLYLYSTKGSEYLCLSWNLSYTDVVLQLCHTFGFSESTPLLSVTVEHHLLYDSTIRLHTRTVRGCWLWDHCQAETERGMLGWGVLPGRGDKSHALTRSVSVKLSSIKNKVLQWKLSK